jgi:hypothetical protein
MSEPIPPAPFNWTTLSQALKIFVVVVVFLAAQQGTQAFTNTFDWTKLMVTGEVSRVVDAVCMGNCLRSDTRNAARDSDSFSSLVWSLCLGLSATDPGWSCSNRFECRCCSSQSFPRCCKEGGACKLKKRSGTNELQ